MTTIAYKDRIIACDTKMCNDGEYQHGIKKIGRSKKYLFGYSGVLGGLIPTFEWLLQFETKCDNATGLYRYAEKLMVEGDDAHFMLIDRDQKLFTMDGDGYTNPIPRGFDAIGSGGAYALGAMIAGKGATAAVDVASSVDAYTGGEICHLQFGDTMEIIHPGVI